MTKQAQQRKTATTGKNHSSKTTRSVSKKPAPSTNKTKKGSHKRGLLDSERKKLALEVFALLLWTVVSVMISQIIVGWIMVAIMGVDSFVQPVSQGVYSALSYVVAFFMIAWLPAKTKIKWKEWGEAGSKNTRRKRPKIFDCKILGIRGLPTWTDVGLAPIGFIVSVLLAGVLMSIFSAFPWFNATQSQSLVFSINVGGFDRIVAFLTLVVVAPIAEELIFRGWLYGKLRVKSSMIMSNKASMAVSTLLTSLLFGIVHLQWNVGVTVFALSVVLCAMREITGTTYAGILTHMIKNGVAFYMLFILGVA